MLWARGVSILTALAATAIPAPPANADIEPCPDVEVIFARGTGEPPGLGRVGDALVATLTPQLGGKRIETYAVNYPASFDFLTTADGANDAAARIVAVLSRCQNAQIVLGGYSQGAAIVDMLANVPPLGDTVGELGSAPPLAPPFADKVTAAAVFGNPAARFGTPLSTVGSFAGKAIDLCNPGDPICSPNGDVVADHKVYEFPPYSEDAAGFAAARLGG
jgi:cutinase